LGCDAYETGGHKRLMGPKGTGLLYIARQSVIRPMQFEESYNTYSDGNGVVNLAAILGLATAIENLQGCPFSKAELAHRWRGPCRRCTRNLVLAATLASYLPAAVNSALWAFGHLRPS